MTTSTNFLEDQAMTDTLPSMTADVAEFMADVILDERHHQDMIDALAVVSNGRETFIDLSPEARWLLIRATAERLAAATTDSITPSQAVLLDVLVKGDSARKHLADARRAIRATAPTRGRAAFVEAAMSTS